MKQLDLTSIEPFEICSIRPPTENFSLTFRLTRNCYWNKCKFCPVYKMGAQFAKRSFEEIKEDIDRAKKIDDLLYDYGIGITLNTEKDHGRALDLIEKIKNENESLNKIRAAEKQDADSGPKEELDPRMEWFQRWFKEAPTIEDSVEHVLTWRLNGARTCFLGDGDSLILKPEFMGKVMRHIKNSFPSLERFTIYGRTRTAARQRAVNDLMSYKSAGIDRVHFGIESGSNRVLEFMNKGESAEDHIKGCKNAAEAELSVSIYVMPGLGGKDFSIEHAHETAYVINKIEPVFIRLRTLEIFPGTPLEEAVKNGEFVEASEDEVVAELRELIDAIEVPTTVYSDSASNLLELSGELPGDRDKMIGAIDEYLSMSDREKLVFSFHSRLQSFIGQYGDLTEEIYAVLKPYIRDKRLGITKASDAEIKGFIRMLRSGLMP